MSILLRHARTQQPNSPVGVDWSNPITRGLVFAAIPYAGVYFDCVTGTFGTNTGTMSETIAPHGGGKSTAYSAARAVSSANASGNMSQWAISPLRGATMVNTGTILALASTVTQVDGNCYTIGGNTDGVSSGHGFCLAVDSFLNTARGNVLKTDAVGVKGASSAALLGNPFDNRLHFFGYSFTGNGTDGYWFAEGGSTAFTGSTAHGTTTTNRQAIIFHPGYSGFSGYRTDSNVALLLMWDRDLMPIEYDALYDNHWLWAQPVARRRWINSVSTSPVLSAATVTSITSTGATPRVTITI